MLDSYVEKYNQGCICALGYKERFFEGPKVDGFTILAFLNFSNDHNFKTVSDRHTINN